jgi:hypothetical protein
MRGYERETLERLPLAEAAYRLLDFVTHEEALDAIYEQYRGRSYTKLIGFPLLVHLTADALVQHRGSGHQSLARAQDAGILPTSLKAAYGKLARMPLRLSQGLLLESSRRLQQVAAPVCCVDLPASLQGMTVLIVDGKKIKRVAHRLKILRNTYGHVLAAKIAVAMNMASGRVVAMSAHPDGEVSDAPLVPELLEQVRGCTSGPRLWVEDRQYCDLNQPRLALADGDHYLIRYNAKVGFHRDLSQPLRHGLNAAGYPYEEEWGWLGPADDPRRQYVRRITLYRVDDEPIILITDLLDADCYPASDLLEVYRQRWGIERVFQRVTEVFHLQTLIGSTPQAGVFQAAFCLILYNIVMVVRGYISQAQQRPAESISTEKLFDDVQRDLVALHEVLSVPEILKLFDERLPGRQLRRRLGTLLAASWSNVWLKAPPKKRRASVKRKIYLKGGHDSVFRLLQKANRRKQTTKHAPRKTGAAASQ